MCRESANEDCRKKYITKRYWFFIVTSSLICWEHIQNNPWLVEISLACPWPNTQRFHYNVPIAEFPTSRYLEWLTQRSLVTSCDGDIELDQYWYRQWLVSWKHQAIHWNSFDLSSAKFHGIHPRSIILLEMFKLSVIRILNKITHSKLPPYPGFRPGRNYSSLWTFLAESRIYMRGITVFTLFQIMP